MKHQVIDSLQDGTLPVLALFGRGFPDSFYKVYLRPTPTGRWHKVDGSGVLALGALDGDPVEYQLGIWRERRATPAWFGQLSDLPLYKHAPGRALDALWARAELLRNETLALRPGAP